MPNPLPSLHLHCYHSGPIHHRFSHWLLQQSFNYSPFFLFCPLQNWFFTPLPRGSFQNRNHILSLLTLNPPLQSNKALDEVTGDPCPIPLTSLFLPLPSSHISPLSTSWPHQTCNYLRTFVLHCFLCLQHSDPSLCMANCIQVAVQTSPPQRGLPWLHNLKTSIHNPHHIILFHCL